MIGVPMNPNSVHVSMIQTGCCKAEFDSTYPIHLNGIISQDEFRESINKINHTVSSSAVKMILVSVIFVLTIIAGTACSVAGGLTAGNSDTYGYPTLIGVGIALSIFGSMFFIFGLLIIQLRRTARMREAVAEESMKYSSRSLTPCSWRLETVRNFFGGYGNYKSQLLYHIVIDIGRAADPGSGAFYSNQVPNESAFIGGQQNNYAPPPYVDQHTGYCRRCNARQQDLSAKFCSSCGHALYNQ